MALTMQIEEFRINDYVPSSELIPVISGAEYPFFSWTFENELFGLSQKSIDLRLSTSLTNWGLDSFEGDVFSKHIEITQNHYSYEEQNLSRGTLYYGQIRLTDTDDNTTGWTTFRFRLNRLPYATRYRLVPSSPSTSDNIDLIYTFNDADNHSQDGTKLRWYRNNLPVPQFDGLCTLPFTATTAGDSWTAKIIPSDGIEFGPTVETSAVVVEEAESNFELVKILPLDANVDDILKLEYSITEGEYIATTGIVKIEWYVNDTLIQDSNQEYIRTSLIPGDVVYAKILLTDGETTFSSQRSQSVIISDVPWYIYNVLINGLLEGDEINDLEPTIDWKLHKTTAGDNDKPLYLKILITKTRSTEGPIYDSGLLEYVKDSFVIPANILSRGQQYFVHIAASDSSTIASSSYFTRELAISGSSWSANVNNQTGWEVEFNVAVAPNTVGSVTPEPNQAVYIHDGTYFCGLILSWSKITLISGTTSTYSITSGPDLRTAKTFKISGKNQDVRVYMDNKLIIDAVGILTNQSLLKTLEFGDLDPKNGNYGVWRFFRYTTDGAYSFEDLDGKNEFYFHNVGTISDGSIDYVFDNKIVWTPDDSEKSSKLLLFNESSRQVRLPTVNRNYSPITSIVIDKNRNKYIGTANGVSVIFGEKHNPDYTLDTSQSVSYQEFDLITTVNDSQMSDVEPSTRAGWLTIDTTYRAVGVQDTSQQIFVEDEYNPYIHPTTSHAIHYYSQRTHGQAWFDNVDNEKGWQVSFEMELEILEADTFEESTDKHGFGIYVNDGNRQEVIYFYEDRIRLFHANVYVPLNTNAKRRYVITGKGDNLVIYQKSSNVTVGGYQKLLDASGLFVTSATRTGNSHAPKIAIDSTGAYHCVWHDDSNRQSQIFYSHFDGLSWSVPQVIYKTSAFSVRNPEITIDSEDKIWVVYEDSSYGRTEISCSVKDRAGWNPKTRITNYASNKFKPSLAADQFDNVHVVWEDDRNGSSQIFWAYWNKNRQAWISSGQFGEDEVIMQFDPNDAYQTVMNFKNVAITSIENYLYIVAEGHFADTGNSAIFSGFRNVETGTGWNSSGAIFIDADGNYSSTGSSEVLSSSERKCRNPKVAASSTAGSIVVIWEDHTEPVSQIWGTALSLLFSPIQPATQITNQLKDCVNPTVGFASNNAAILFESNGTIMLSYYSSTWQEFRGSQKGEVDHAINTGINKINYRPSIPGNVVSKTFLVAYEFRTASTNFEDTEFSQIGSATIWHGETTSSSAVSKTETLSDNQISHSDTKEFAFGDFSENVGLRVHYKDLNMYFGYDAVPHSISKLNTSTVSNWPDDRINDLFVDAYGNVVAATFHGLVYHNLSTGQSTNIKGLTNAETPEELLTGKIITSVKWGRSGIWYVGTTDGLYFTKSAGKYWSRIDSEKFLNKLVHSIAVNKDGQAIVAVSSGSSSSFNPDQDGIYVVYPGETSRFIRTGKEIRTVAIDEDNIIWAGGDSGLLRIENFSSENMISFSRAQGMVSSHVNSIVIVNKYIRYIATASGIEKMHGTKFTNISSREYEFINNNIASLTWYEPTKSLWIGNLYSLHEIVFRDDAHEIVERESVQYDNLELTTEQSFDRNVYYILDYSELQEDPNNPIKLTTESAKVYINRNPVDFGYTIDEIGYSILFNTDILAGDQVEVGFSSRFNEFHDFTQTSIEREILGLKKTCITKMDSTSKGQILLLSGCDRPAILLFNEQQLANLPFTTIMLDRDVPQGCLELLQNVTRTTLRFRILAYDALSGIDSYILSNYENFTSDGTEPLDYTDFKSVVDHNIGDDINNVTDSLQFPDTTTINGTTYSVGSGAALTYWIDQEASNERYLYAATSAPAIIYKYTPATDTWQSIAILDALDTSRIVNDMKTFFNTIFVTTGTSGAGNGGIYKSVDGATFTSIGSVTGSQARGIVSTQDGTIYIGSSDGKIYQYKNNALSVAYSNIGQSVYSLAVFENILVVGTGTQGRVYTINLTTGDNLIIFDGAETSINQIHIKDSQSNLSPDQTDLFAGTSDSTTIYRTNMDTFDFTKSYSSFNKSINRIESVNTSVLTEPGSASVTGTTTVTAIGDSLYKYLRPSWEFFYRHSEEIVDFIEFTTGETPSLWIVSQNKVTKWTPVLTKKTVYLRLKDKAGNISSIPVTTPTCPTDEISICCNYAYSINIQDLKDFVNEGRIVDISEYGEIIFSYDSPNRESFFSANQIEEEIGIYISEVFNGSNDLVSWRTITWSSTEPQGTTINIQIRSSSTEDGILSADWSDNLEKDDTGIVSLEHITSQYLQFRAILSSEVRGLSPSLSSITIRNLTTQASHFFTTNFVLPSRPIKGLLTANTFIPVSADIVFGINTKNTTDFGDYQIIEPNRLFATANSQFGSNLRIGAKLLSPAIPQLTPSNNPNDPYDASSFLCTVDFSYKNLSSSAVTYNFRVRFYNDLFRTQLIHTFYTGNDQTGWSLNGSDIFPASGTTFNPNETKNITFTPGDAISATQRWYVSVDAYNGSFFESILDNKSFICSTCNLTNEPGLVCQYYRTGLSQSMTEVPHFNLYTPDHVCIEPTINFPLTDATWVSSCGTLTGYTNNFALRARGRIQAPVTGAYEFTLSSDDGSILFIDGTEIVNMNRLQSYTSRSGTIDLSQGFHEIEIQYFERTGGAGLHLQWKIPGDTTSTTVPASRLYHVVTSEYCELEVPKILNFAILFELENGETVKVNLS